MRIKYTFVIIGVAVVLSSCAQKASWHANDIAQNEKQSFTVGEIQRNIRKGMPSSEVAEILGSPNIVSTDEQGREVWIYDKFHTENVVSASNGLTLTMSNVLGGASRSSQSTITVIIKYDSQAKVRDYAYHTSRF